MGNLLNEILVGNFPNLCNDIDNNLQEAFWSPNKHDQKRKPHAIS
jgi:hypothetical protein